MKTQISDAFCAGMETATALTVGAQFVGAFPAAENAGFIKGSNLYFAFCEGFIAGLPGTIETDMAGVITAIESRA